MRFKIPLFIMILSISTFGASIVLTPETLIKSEDQIPDFEAIIPAEFGGWVTYERPFLNVVDPELQESVDAIYNETLIRTYVNKAEQTAIMLSLAYGIDQRDSMQVHKPEICYPAQGFVLRDQRRNSFQFNDRLIPIKQLDTQRRNRREFVTYWILVGDQLAKSNTDGKLIKLKYGFKGVIPDGLLFRVSSVGMNANQHYTMQQSFLEELLRAIDTKDLPKVIGVK